MRLNDFLRFIWPAPNPVRYFISGQSVDDGGKEYWFNRRCDSVESAVATVTQLIGKGFDVYHCCPAFTADAPARKNQYAVATRTLYLDLDVARPGSSKPNTYATPRDAVKALDGFVASTGLPQPNLIVSSGWGIHVYWVLDTDLSVAQWQPMAHRLRDLAVQHGVRFDQQVTTTLSRVLRTPGSWNYKNRDDPRQAKVLFCNGKHLPADALSRLVQIGTGLDRQPVGQAPRSTLGTSDLSAGMEKLQRPSSMANVIRQCPVMQQMFLTGGDMGGYPLWRDMLSVAAHTDDGHLFIGPMSVKHRTYSRGELERQWGYACEKKANGFLGPARCATIAGEGGQAEICKLCPHNGVLTSPVQLSYTVPRPDAPPASASTAATSPASVVVQGVVGLATDPEPPYGFAVLAQGGYGGYILDKETDTQVLVPVLNGRVSRIERRHEDVRGINARPGSEPVILITQYHANMNGAGRSIRVPMGALNLKNDAILGGLGFVVAPGRHREALQMFRSWSDQLARSSAGQFEVKHYGWCDHGSKRGFALGDRMYWEDGRAEKTTLPPTTAPIYAPHGTLQDWQAAAQAHHDAFTPALRCILASSFAAPLVHLSGRTGGRLLSVVGTSTGVGKTTAMDLAQTVWGDAVGTLRMNATVNSVPEFIAQLKSLPVFWDEARGHDPDAFMNLMFSVVEGRGRMRLTSTAEIREAAHWNNMVVVTSNFSTRDRAAASETVDGEGPQKARVFECTVPSAANMQHVDGLHLLGQLAVANRGTAGDEYIKFIAPRWREIAGKLAEVEAALTKMTGAPSSSRFHVSTMALLLVGAYLATQAGILRFDIPSLREYLLKQYFSMITEHATAVVETPQEAASSIAMQTIEQFLTAHQGSTLATWSSPVKQGRPHDNRILKQPARPGEPVQVHIILNQAVMLIDNRAFNNWLVKTGRVKQIIRHLFQTELGVTEAQRTLGVGTPYSRLKVWCAVVPLQHPELAELAQSYGNAIQGFQMPVPVTDTPIPALDLAPSPSPYLQ